METGAYRMKKIILALCIVVLLALPTTAILRINSNLDLITGGAGNFTNVTVNQYLYASQWLISSGSFVGNITSDGDNFTFNIPSGNLKSNGQSVCLENGTYCQAVASTSDGTGGWTNTTTLTNTNLNVGINNAAASVPLDVYMTSTSQAIRWNWNVTSAFIGAMKFYKSGNSSSNSGNARSGDELMVIEADYANGSGSYVRRGYIGFLADGNHDGSTQAGTRFVIQVTDRNTNNLVQGLRVTGTGVSITNSTSVGTQPNDRLYVDGNINTTQTIKFGVYAFPACSSSTKSAITYNYTSNKHVGCNGTAWNNLY